MSVSNIPDPLMVLDAAIHQHKINVELQKLDDLLVDLKKDKDQVPTQIPEPTVRWRKRDKDGNTLYKRPRSTRNQLRKTPHRRKTSCPSQPSNIHCEVAFAPETVESFLQELQSSLNDAAGQPVVPKAPLASTNWSRRKSLFSESWKAERPRLVNTMAAQQSVSAHLCQHCGNNPSALRCRDCLPHPFFCEKCDVMMHTKHVFHNRETIIAGFFQPLPPTTYVLNTTLCHDARFVPVEIPVRICDCPSECLRIKAGKAVTVVTINGRYDLSMPELRCEGCEASWTCGVHDLNLTDYWPATLHFSTLSATDVLFTFEEMKMAAPGLSCQAFLKMLDQRTVRFGRTGKISADSFLKSFFEWEAIRYELDKMLRTDPIKCQACTPDMLAVSVDGNRKHYRFKNAARLEEQALFQDLFIAKDEDVRQFVDYIHKSTKHTSGRGVCGGQWSAARETSHRSSSKLDEEHIWAFDGILTVKRLEEEKRILVGEMDRHWKSLSSYEDALKELPRLLSSGKFKSSSCSLTDEALRGLQSIILRELQHLKQMKLQAREHYLQTLSGAESVSFDDTSDDDFGSDSEASDNSL